MTEVQAILFSGGGIMLVTAVGWGATAWRRNRQNGLANGVSVERQDNMEKRLDELPCQDNKYLIEWGMIKQGQEAASSFGLKLFSCRNQSACHV